MYILFDIGGTKIRIAASSDLKDFGEPQVFPTPQSYTEGIQIFRDVITSLTSGEKVLAASGGIAGPLNHDKSKLVGAPHLPDWIDKPLQKDLSEIIGTTVHLENDSALVGLGEAVFGAGRGSNIVVYITVSTGLGGSRFVNGKIDSNSMGFEPGHQIVNFISPNWQNTNKAGYFEDYVSGKAVLARYQKKPQDIHDEKIWDDQARLLAIGLNNIIVLWSPECIVLGGSTMQHIPIDKVQKYTKEFLRIFPEPPTLVRSELGDFGGLYGAMAYLS